jgi:hypothetical protein
MGNWLTANGSGQLPKADVADFPYTAGASLPVRISSLTPHLDTFHLFFQIFINLFRSKALLCYTANATKKQAKKQKQVKTHERNDDSPSNSRRGLTMLAGGTASQ